MFGVRDAPRPQASFWQQLSYGRLAISQIQTTLWIELQLLYSKFCCFMSKKLVKGISTRRPTGRFLLK